MFTLRNAAILTGTAVVLLTSAFFMTRVEMPPWAGLLSGVNVVLFALPSFYALKMWLGLRDAAVVVAALGVFALIVESSAIVTGFPYGHFGYSDLLGYKLFGLTPWTVAFAWSPLVLGSYAVAATYFRSAVGRVAATAVMLTAADLVLDPGAVLLGFWKYASADFGTFYSVPVSNYLGWLFSGTLGAGLLEFIFSRIKPLMRAPVQLASSLILIVFFWAAVAGFGGLTTPAAIGVLLVAALSVYFVKEYFAFEDMVVLVDDNGRPAGTANKYLVHDADTPLHRAFSVFLLNPSGELLLQQRAHSKKTWPGVWSNSCCGHQMLHENIEDSARRRLFDELRLRKVELHLVLPDYRYRAEKDGVVENEICPVFLAFSSEAPTPNPDEVAAVKWIDWDDAWREVSASQNGYSPWAVEELRLLLDDNASLRLIAERCPAAAKTARAAAA